MGVTTLHAAAADASWTLEPGPVALVLSMAGLFVWRWRAARATGGARAASGARLAAFMAGVALLAVALISPVDRLGEQLFAMHMVQHVILLDLAAILLVAAPTKVMMRPVARGIQAVEERAAFLGSPAFAVAVYVGVMWLWHVPALYDAANENAFVHVTEHVLFLSAGLLYWWHLLSPLRSRLRLGGLGPVVYMAATKVLVGLLGVGLTFAPDALYSFYSEQPRVWGLSATDDQAIAGAIMALEQALVMGVALAWIFIRALGESDAADHRADRYG